MNKGLCTFTAWLVLANLAGAQSLEPPVVEILPVSQTENPAPTLAAPEPLPPVPAMRPPSPENRPSLSLVQTKDAPSTPAAAAGACTSLFEQAGCDHCRRTSFSAEYLLWWVRRGPLPIPLVSAGTVNTGDPLTSSGPVTGPGTVVLLGGQQLDFEAFSGGRLMFESWSSRNDNLGLQVGGFRLEQRSVGFRAASDAAGNPIIARPIFDALNNVESALLVAFPSAFAGGIGVRADSNLWGLESSLMVRGRWDECRHTKWLLGFRHLDLEESIETAQGTRVLPGGGGSFNNVELNPGDFVAIVDRFRGRNEFYGALFGVQTEAIRDCWSFGLSFKVSLGCNRQEVHAIGGSERFDAAGALTDTAFGGGLAVRTNSGTFHQDEFTVIPELGLKAAYQVNDRWRMFVGYDLIYWSDVVRPGNQINRIVNVSHVPTTDLFNSAADPRQPGPLFRNSDFWAQGVSFGIELRY